jgi:site-specific recombinase XerD
MSSPSPVAGNSDEARRPIGADVMLGADGVLDAEPIPPAEAALGDEAARYARAARAESTWRAYDTDLRQFAGWAARHHPGRPAVPASPVMVADYLASLADAGYRPSTIRRRLAAISVAHQLGRHPNPAVAPEVATVWDGIRRTSGVAPRRKRALETGLLVEVLAAIGTEAPADLRDRALLLVGFAGCLRRAELVALDVADVTETDDGLILAVRSSKTDQERAGAQVGLAYGAHRPTCPVRSWRAWREHAELVDGPAFRAVNRHGTVGAGRLDPGSVARIVRRRAEAAGLVAADFAGHSLRSGFATAAARAGVADRAIMRQGRWRSASSLDSYVRAGRLFDRDNPSGHVGL